VTTMPVNDAYGGYGDYGDQTAAGAAGVPAAGDNASGERLDLQIANSMMQAMAEVESNRERKVDDIMIDILMQGDLTSYGTPELSFENLFESALNASSQMIKSGNWDKNNSAGGSGD
jgi:hypothetical protein